MRVMLFYRLPTLTIGRNGNRVLRTRASRCAFSLIEALVSTSLAAMASSALLLGIASSLQATKAAQEEAIANGLAQQLIDEIAGKKYCEDVSQAYQHPLAANNTELAGPGWSRFNDIDDFVAIENSPPTDAWEIALGDDDGRGGLRHPNFRAAQMLSNWRQEVDVYYVDSSDLTKRLSGSQTSPYRAVEVRIFAQQPDGAKRLLAKRRRVFAHVPTP